MKKKSIPMRERCCESPKKHQRGEGLDRNCDDKGVKPQENQNTLLKALL